MQGIHDPSLFKEKCFINGTWLGSNNKKQIAVFNPFDHSLIGHVPNCGIQETARAIAAADAAQPDWALLTAKARSEILHAWAALIDVHKQDLAIIMTTEQGKPLKEALGEIDYANDYIRWYAEEARRVYGDIMPANKTNQRVQVIRQPVGVVVAITPWNFPAAMLTRKIAPALAVGCTMVAKPAAETPFSALALAFLAEKAGMPAGVINIITGDAEPIAKEMTSNPLVRKLSFTGSTAVGRSLMAACAPGIKKVSLELGGNAPFIVFDDADLDAAVAGAIACKFRNAGQTCVSANRFYVQDGVYQAFTDKLVQAVKTLKLGNGLEPDVQIGPLINEEAIKKVKRHLDDALAKGAKIALGGQASKIGSLFFEPTVLTEMQSDMMVAKEETFGPIAPLFKFKNDTEVINLANNTAFGLAAYFYSKNLNRIYNVAEALDYGMVGVNTGLISGAAYPFGGIKQSGIGREGSQYGLDAYLEMKYICLELG